MIIENIALNNAQILIPAKDFADTIKNIFEEVLKTQNFHFEQAPLINRQDDSLLTRKEACLLLGISLPTLSKYVTSGKLPYSRIGKKILFDKDILLKSIEKRGGKNVK